MTCSPSASSRGSARRRPDKPAEQRLSAVKNAEMLPIFYAHFLPYDCKLVTRICLHNSLRSSWADVPVLLDSWVSSYGLTVHDADTTINGFWTSTTSTFIFSFMNCFLMVSYSDCDGAGLLIFELVRRINCFCFVKPRQG